MRSTFSKSILKVGTYHSPDGVVNVTPQRLRHWEKSLKRLQNVGYAIPSHFDHSSDLELLEPITMDVLERGQNRSASATVGRLSEFKVSPDGKSAEIVLETLTPQATQSVESNAVYISPVIFPEWKDGAGNVHRDVITSFDLVDHPVDYSQTSFVPAVRMGLNSKPFVLSGVRLMSTNTKRSKSARKRDAAARRARFQAAVRMGLADDEDDDGDEKPADTAGKDTPSAADDASPTDTLDIEPSVAPDLLDQTLNLLAEYGVVLPDDTTDDNLITSLRTALTALLNSDSEEDEPEDDVLGDADALPSTAPGTMPQASAPMIATMSVQQKALHNWAETTHKNLIAKRLHAVLHSGRCTPAEADERQRQLQVVKLSLTNEGLPAPTEVEGWIESREAVPEGTFWTDKQRTKSMQRLSVVEPPTEWKSTGGRTKSEYDEAIVALGGKP